jgi:hypothetical protein
MAMHRHAELTAQVCDCNKHRPLAQQETGVMTTCKSLHPIPAPEPPPSCAMQDHELWHI